MWELIHRWACSTPKMEDSSLQSKSQLHNQQQQQLPDSDSDSHSDPSVNDDHLAQSIADDLQNLVLSSSKHQVEDQVQQAVDELAQVVNEAVDEPAATGGDEPSRLEADRNEARVLEERGGGESEIEGEDVDLEVEVEDEDVSSEIEGVSVQEDGGLRGHCYPLRLDAEDCGYYMRTGMCKFGSTCRFNHPITRKNQQPTKDTKKHKEEKVERHGQIECKYHTSAAGCKHGKACKFNHGRGKTVKTPVVEYNFVGLPIRPGEKECPYYMRNGSCKYGPSCRFNHPDPTAAGGSDSPKTYGNDVHVPLPLQPAPPPNIPTLPTWSAPRTPDPTAAFVPMMYPPTQNMPPPNPDWNAYQAPAHLYPSSERALPIPPALFLNNAPGDTNIYTHHQQPMVVSEYPERPGQPDCSHFMKTGVCKFRASCKFNHPQRRITRTTRDQNICSYFSRHGTCKFGSACKYDHPVNYNSNSNPAGEGYNGSNRPRPLIQQSV